MFNNSRTASIFFVVFVSVVFLLVSVGSAVADSSYRNNQSWSGPGPTGTITITFSTPAGPPSNPFVYSSCTSASDFLSTTGVPSNWTLNGQVNLLDGSGHILPNGSYPVNQTGDLNLTVFYPPFNALPPSPIVDTRTIVVDLAIAVKDASNNPVNWLGYNHNGVLGPNQNWTVLCTNPPAPAIRISKYTNGADANDPNGTGVPRLAAGTPINWTYQLTNTGSIPVAEKYLNVTDSQLSGGLTSYQVISGNGDKIFDPGEVWQYKATGTAVDLSAPPPGIITVTNSCTENKTKPPSSAYVNIGTVTPLGGPSSSDPSSYCNPAPSVAAIGILKYVSVDNQATWDNADTAPGPRATFNSNVFFKFWVNNSGIFTLTSIKLTDNTYSTSNCTIPSSMAPGDSFTCIIGPFPATLGQHTNTATATGNWTSGTVTDQDSANYYSKLFFAWLPLIAK